MNKSNSLVTRNKMKSKKPLFQRQDANIFRQFRGQWRKPKGIHSKLRRGFRGHGGIPSIGYSSPKDVKGILRKGLYPFVVHNVNDLLKLDPKLNVVVIAHGVGVKKRTEILNKVKEMKLPILGIKDVDLFLNKINEKLQMNKKKSEKKKDDKKKKLEQAQNVKEDKNKVEDKKNESKK